MFAPSEFRQVAGLQQLTSTTQLVSTLVTIPMTKMILSQLKVEVLKMNLWLSLQAQEETMMMIEMLHSAERTKEVKERMKPRNLDQNQVDSFQDKVMMERD